MSTKKQRVCYARQFQQTQTLGPGMEGGATRGSGVRTDVSTDREGSPGTPVAEKTA